MTYSPGHKQRRHNVPQHIYRNSFRTVRPDLLVNANDAQLPQSSNDEPSSSWEIAITAITDETPKLSKQERYKRRNASGKLGIANAIRNFLNDDLNTLPADATETIEAVVKYAIHSNDIILMHAALHLIADLVRKTGRKRAGDCFAAGASFFIGTCLQQWCDEAATKRHAWLVLVTIAESFKTYQGWVDQALTDFKFGRKDNTWVPVVKSFKVLIADSWKRKLSVPVQSRFIRVTERRICLKVL